MIIKKKFRAMIKQAGILNQITEMLKKKEMSIAEIIKAMNMKRSTLMYYLNILEETETIKRTRILKGVKGSPTIISLNKETLERLSRESAKRKRDIERKYLSEPCTKILLKALGKYPKLQIEELYTATKKIDPSEFRVSQTLAALSFLEAMGFVKAYYELSPEGKSYLKEEGKNGTRKKHRERIRHPIGEFG